VNHQGKEFMVHLNRLKGAYKQRILQEKERDARKERPKRRKPEVEDEMPLAAGSKPFHAHLIVNHLPVPVRPNRNNP
jgi:hypothetical protein